MKNKEIVINLINNEYRVIVCWGSDKYIDKVLKAWWHEPLSEKRHGNRGICYMTKQCNPVIALPKPPRTATEIATLAHEAYHAVINIMDMLGEKFLGGEVPAHSIGAIVRETLKQRYK